MSVNEVNRTQLWAGRIVSGLVALALTGSGLAKLSHQPEMVTNFVEKFGFQEGTLSPIGITELLCVALYAFPRTSILGAIVLTGYMGGAVATHVRIGEPIVAPLVIGILAWLGLFLRMPAIRALIPWKK